MKYKLFYTITALMALGSMVLASCASSSTATTVVGKTSVPEVTTAPKTTTEATKAPSTTTEATTAPAETTAPTGANPWSNKLVREAVAAAIDREAIVDRVFQGQSTPAYSMIPPGYPFFTEPFRDKYGTRNLDMAKQLLTEAGYSTTNKLAIDLWYPPEHYGATTADVMQVIKGQLEETGMMTVNLQSQSWAEYINAVADGTLPFFILGWFPDFADPDNWLSPFASCTGSPDQGVNYCSPQMDQLLAQASSATDNTQRGDLYKQVGQLYAEDVPTIPLFWDPEFITNRAGVQGIKIGPPFEFNYSPLSFSADAKPASGANDTLIIGTTDQLNSLDPQDAYATHDWEILKNTGVSLMKYTPGTADLVPGAAADAPVASDNAKTWTFKLRDNLVFADGTKITSQNYVDAWTRLNKIQGQVAGLVKTYVDSVEAPDPLTVVYHLKNPTSFFPAVAATPPFIPVNPADGFTADAILAYPKTLNGMGPYKMTSYTSGQQLVLEANENYWGDDKPTIKKIIVQYFADPTTLANAVSNGSIDIAWRKLGPQEAQQLQTVQGLTVTKINAPALRYLVMNETWKP